MQEDRKARRQKGGTAESQDSRKAGKWEDG